MKQSIIAVIANALGKSIEEMSNMNEEEWLEVSKQLKELKSIEKK